MRNIHTLPTDKPSRLFIDENILILDNEYLPNIPSDGQNLHIYITNDEEPKSGDYAIITLNGNSEVVQLDQSTCIYYDFKIILTTDQDLIKDGVQSIPDEFLEWFVSNQSCQKVEVEDDIKYFNIDELRDRSLKRLPYTYSEKIGYKIIIPKEEMQKQEQGNIEGKDPINIEGKDPINIEGKDPIFYESKQQAQTAVEWFANAIKGLDTGISYHYFEDKIQQAKEMEKQQILEARVKKPLQSEWDEAEQYYNETFNK